MRLHATMMRVRRVLYHLAIVWVIGTGPVHADWLNTTGAETAANFVEFDILDDSVRVALEIDVPDYPAFVPEPVQPIASNAAPDVSDLSPTTGTTFQVEMDGVAIKPRIEAIEVRDRKPRPTAGTPAVAPPPRGARVIAVTLQYPHSGRPEALTFIPPTNERGEASVSLGFLAHHMGVPVTDYRYLSQAERLTLDWADPWYSAFENPNLTRHHRSALMSFVSIGPRECRHEIIFRLRDLEGWTDLDLGGSTAIDTNQRAHITQVAEQFFRGLNPLVEDGAAQKPASVRVVFLKVGAEGVRIIDDDEAIDPVTALLGAVLSYPHRTLPEKLDVTWQLFTDRAQVVPVSVADPAGAVPGQATPDAPEIAWTNFLKTWEDPTIVQVAGETRRSIPFPVLSILLFGVAAACVVEATRSQRRGRWAALVLVAGFAGLAALKGPALSVKLPGGPDRQAVTKVTQAIVRNAGVAMLEPEQESFTKALESFVMQADLGPVGAEMRRGLTVALPSGARALTDAIEDVTVEDVTPREGGMRVLARWTARMSGGHWGHMHRREIQYQALMDLVTVDGVWRLCGLTVLSARPKPMDEPSI